MGERGAPAHGEIAAFGEMPWWDGFRIQALQTRGKVPRLKPRGIDEEAGLDLGRLRAAGTQHIDQRWDLSKINAY